MHFDQNNAVHRALRRITTRLTELGIPHAVSRKIFRVPSPLASAELVTRAEPVEFVTQVQPA